jgi:alkyl hydroperoxide reductase subunit AhpF
MTNYSCRNEHSWWFGGCDCTDNSYKQFIILMGTGTTEALGDFDFLIRYEYNRLEEFVN